MKLLFSKGPFFYTEYNVRLYLFLLFNNVDIILANDLDTLPANYLISRVKKIPLVYDSHEYFTEVPELVNRPKIKRIWEWIEQIILPNIKFAYTVCESIAIIYREKYGVPFRVVRNLPFSYSVDTTADENAVEKRVIYQGSVNMGRGLEQAIKAMKYIKNVRLIIAGDGDIKTKLENLAKKENLTARVEFTGRLSFEELLKLTLTAHLGLSIEEDLGLNYRFTLPNKLFDYIQARIPVLVTDLPEMAAIVNQYKIGVIINSIEPKFLAKRIDDALRNNKERKIWFENLPSAANELIWENEEKIVKEIFSELLTL